MSDLQREKCAVFLVGIGGRYHLVLQVLENCDESRAFLSLGGVGCQDTAVRLWRALEARSGGAYHG